MRTKLNIPTKARTQSFVKSLTQHSNITNDSDYWTQITYKVWMTLHQTWIPNISTRRSDFAMDCPHVIFHWSLTGISVITKLAREASALMFIHVSLIVICFIESLPADLAIITIFACVNLHVSVQVRWVSKTLVTQCAEIWLPIPWGTSGWAMVGWLRGSRGRVMGCRQRRSCQHWPLSHSS